MKFVLRAGLYRSVRDLFHYRRNINPSIPIHIPIKYEPTKKQNRIIEIILTPLTSKLQTLCNMFFFNIFHTF